MKIERILEKSEKKIDLKNFFEEGDYLTIRKLPYSVKKKIQFLSMNTMSGQAGKSMLKEMKAKGLTQKDLEKLTEEEQIEFMVDMKIDQKSADAMAALTTEITRQILDHGIDPDEHSFTDEKEKKIKLNYEIFELIGNEDLIDFIVTEIKKFSKEFSLGEQTEKA